MRGLTAPEAPSRLHLGIAAKQAAFGYAILLPTLVDSLRLPLPADARGVLSSAFSKYDLIHPPKFVGFANFVDLLHDPLFLKSARISLTYVVFSVLPVLAAVARPGDAVQPQPVPEERAAVGGVHAGGDAGGGDGGRVDLHVSAGRRAQHRCWAGSASIPMPWLRSSSTALPAVILIGIWRATPYYMVIFLAGLQAIPGGILRSRRDRRRRRLDDFPGHHPAAARSRPRCWCMVMTVIVAMKVFAVPMIMTGGGPSDSTRVLPLFIYQTAFEFFDMGRAAAMSVFLFVARHAVLGRRRSASSRAGRSCDGQPRRAGRRRARTAASRRSLLRAQAHLWRSRACAGARRGGDLACCRTIWMVSSSLQDDGEHVQRADPVDSRSGQLAVLCAGLARAGLLPLLLQQRRGRGGDHARQSAVRARSPATAWPSSATSGAGCCSS